MFTEQELNKQRFPSQKRWKAQP